MNYVECCWMKHCLSKILSWTHQCNIRNQKSMNFQLVLWDLKKTCWRYRASAVQHRKAFFLFRYCLQASRRVTMLSQMMHTEDRNLFGIVVVLARAWATAHIVWNLLKMSHLNFWILAFSTNFCPIKTDLSGNTVWPQALGFQKLAKLDHFWHF